MTTFMKRKLLFPAQGEALVNSWTIRKLCEQSVDFGSTSNRKNLKISVFGCFRVNLLEFGFRKYDLRKFGKLCNLLLLFFYKFVKL